MLPRTNSFEGYKYGFSFKTKDKKFSNTMRLRLVLKEFFQKFGRLLNSCALVQGLIMGAF